MGNFCCLPAAACIVSFQISKFSLDLSADFLNVTIFAGVSLVLLSSDGYCSSVRSYNQHFAVIIFTFQDMKKKNTFFFWAVFSSTRLFLSFWRPRREIWPCSRPSQRASGFTPPTARWQHQTWQNDIIWVQITTVCSLTLLHLVPLVCLAYLNCAIYTIIRSGVQCWWAITNVCSQNILM